MRQIALALATVIATLLACGGDKDPKPGAENNNVPSISPPLMETVEAAADAGAVTAITHLRLEPGVFATVGIATCDSYIEKQRECLEKNAPVAIRKAQLDGLQSIAAKWAEASSADRREQLEKTCAHMTSSSEKATTRAWECKW